MNNRHSFYVKLHSSTILGLERVNLAIERIGYARTALFLVIALVLILIVLRSYHASVTGYLLPDEAFYYNISVLDGFRETEYRPFFHVVYLLFFGGVRDVWTFLLRGALYSALWAVSSIIMTYKIITHLHVADKTAALLILSLPLFPVFTIMVPMILTETLALFLALVGIYFAHRYLDSLRVVDALLAAIGFVTASLVRQPYLLLSLGAILAILLPKRRSLAPIVAYSLLLLLIFPIPIRLTPLQFAQPVYSYLTNLLVQLPRVGLAAALTSLRPGVLMAPRVWIPHGASSYDILYAFVVGLLYGYNPLFTVFVFVSLGLVAYAALVNRTRMAVFDLLIMTLALLSSLISIVVIVSSLTAAVSTWTSTIIRMTHTSLPAIFGLRRLYAKLRPRQLVAILLIFLVLASTQIPQFLNAAQRSLTITGEPINRLSLDYKAPYYRLYLLAKDSGETLVIGGSHMRGIRTYMSMLPNVTLSGVPKTQAEFSALVNREWQTIFLYDDWITIAKPSLANVYPTYYREILLSRSFSGFVLDTLWVDGESYAIRMTRTSAVPSQTNCPAVSFT